MRLILLPGMDGSGELFEPFIACLPPSIKPSIVAYPNSEILSLPQLVEYVNTKLPLNEDYVLLGESMSAAIAFKIAEATPERLKGVIYVCGFLAAPITLASLLSRMPLDLLLRLPMPNFIVRRYLLGSDAKDELITLLREVLSKVRTEVLASRLRNILKLSIETSGGDLPSIYLQAESDRLVAPHAVDAFCSRLNHLLVQGIAGPHFLLQARAMICAEIVASFISQLEN